jgi:hypothetical protein
MFDEDRNRKKAERCAKDTVVRVGCSLTFQKKMGWSMNCEQSTHTATLDRRTVFQKGCRNPSVTIVARHSASSPSAERLRRYPSP